MAEINKTVHENSIPIGSNVMVIRIGELKIFSMFHSTKKSCCVYRIKDVGRRSKIKMPHTKFLADFLIEIVMNKNTGYF